MAWFDVHMTFDPSDLTAYVNGEYVDATRACVSIFDHGFLYGDGVFEGMRVFEGGLFRAELHMERLARSTRTIGLAMPRDLLGINRIELYAEREDVRTAL